MAQAVAYTGMNSAPAIRRRAAVAVDHHYWPEDLPPLLRRLYAARGLDPDSAQLHLAKLLPPQQLSGLNQALDLLQTAIETNQHIVIVGDFDCDGATGTAVAVRGLRVLGAQNVSYAVPNRLEHGYGLSAELVTSMASMQPQLIITVDNGIACHGGVLAAKQRGWQVLITDHHLPGPSLPPADAIVNPNLPDDHFPSKAIAGVGVMFYLLLALRQRQREQGAYRQKSEPDLSALLDLVAVGTVADLVRLDDNNRRLVAAGLKRLRAGKGCAGLNALAQAANAKMATLNATDIGFGIAPRINAAGRLEDMTIGIECLLTDDPGRAMQLAALLDDINSQRKTLQAQMVDDADTLIAGVKLDSTNTPASAWCLFDRHWHPGVIGLVASKLKERLHRPIIAFAPADAGEGSEPSSILRGSARSIPGFHIRDALAQVDAMHPGLIERFGGHAMAAGLSLPIDHFEAFRDAFVEVANKLLDQDSLRHELWSDGPLAHNEYRREIADLLRLAGPWGQGFAEPIFDDVFEVVDSRRVGEKHLKLTLKHSKLSTPLNAIYFDGWNDQRLPDRVHLAFRLQADDWRGGSAIQLHVVAMQQV